MTAKIKNAQHMPYPANTKGSSASASSPGSGSTEKLQELETVYVDEKPTEWKSIILATVINFLTLVEASIISNGEWPYMSQIDPSATSSFYGIVTAVCKAGHAVFVLVFAFWSHRWGVIKIPVLAGRIISLLGGVLYLFVDFFPTNRRYVLLASYFIFGVGSSPTPLLRSYVSAKSADAQKTKAFALMNVATVLSVLVGPLVQLAFSMIEYPGKTIVGQLKFHIYSAPMYIALILNIAAIFIVACLFHDPPRESKELHKGLRRSSFSLASLKKKWSSLRSLPFSWPLVIVLILQKAFSMVTQSTMMATMGPILMVVFALSGTEVVQLMSIAQVIVGVLAIALSLLFIFANLGKWLSNRLLFLLAYIIIILMYIVSYSWPMWSGHLKPFNETTFAGCNPSEYGWCNTVLASSLWTLIPILVAVMGLCLPATAISLDAIYAKVLGDIDQSFMQSVLAVAEDVILVVGPIYSSAIFTAAGMSILWIVNFSITIVAIVVWLAVWRPIGKYQ